MIRPLLLALLITLPALLPARAAIVFTPHVSEYAKLSRGAYLDTTLVHASIDKIWDADGHKVALGNTAIPPGQSISASLLLTRYLWIGNLFEDSALPLLADHDQVFRVIGTFGRQSGSGAINDLSRQFGMSTSASGIGDLFLLAGVYGETYHWGPLHGNGLYTVTVKAPIGSYQQDSLLNTGTNYWTVAPQLSHHQDWFGRLSIEATAAVQFNGSNDRPAYGGLTPTHGLMPGSLAVRGGQALAGDPAGGVTLSTESHQTGVERTPQAVLDDRVGQFGVAVAETDRKSVV